MRGLSVVLREVGSAFEAGPYALPPHTRERLIADAHLAAVLEGRFPNGGPPLEKAWLGLEKEQLVVRLRSAGAGFEKRYPDTAVQDDVEALLSRLRAADAVPAGSYRYRLEEAEGPEPASGALRVRPFPRTLPVLERLSLPALGVSERPRCAHATILLPRGEAEALLAHARSAPDVEVAALLVAQPFLVEEEVPFPLGIRVQRVLPLAQGTADDGAHVRVPPEALAAARVDESRGEVRAGLAHSHPFGTGHSLFLSSEDKAFATAFFHRPWQIQVVVDPGQEKPEQGLAAFAWSDAQLARVCLQLVEEAEDPEEGSSWP